LSCYLAPHRLTEPPLLLRPQIYIRRASEAFGVARTREIYQKAIEALPDADLNVMCTQYAAMEKGLGEVDRARAILLYGAQVHCVCQTTLMSIEKHFCL
jgi:hypothetical protein